MSIGEEVIIGMVLLNLLVTWMMARVIARLVKAEARNLGFQTSEAIQGAIGTLVGSDIEAPNPIQAAIAQFIQTRLAPTAQIGEATELSRNDQGRFT